MEDLPVNTKGYVDNVQRPGKLHRIRVRRFSWLPRWFPFNKRSITVFSLDTAPAAGADVVIVYDACNDA
jgi:hypothetical protein